MQRALRSALAALAIIVTAWATPVANAGDNIFSGRAFVVAGTVEGIAVGPLVDTGEVGAEGGSLHACLAAYPASADDDCLINLPDPGDPTNGALEAEVLHAAVVAHGSRSSAEATVATFSLAVPGLPAVEGEAVTANATAECRSGAVSLAADTEVLALSVGGQQIAIDPLNAKQTIDVPGFGTIVLNADPVATVSGNHGRIEARAVQIDLTNPFTGKQTSLTIAFAEADITCFNPPPPPPCPSPAFATSGGFVTGPEMNFAAAGRTGDSWGHVIVRNRQTGDKLQATQILSTAFEPTPGEPDTAVIKGLAKVNGSGGYPFTVRLQDWGEPGRDDTFALESTHPALNHLQAKLAGGNVQFHRPCKK